MDSIKQTDEITSMEQLGCPNGCRQALELNRKASNFGLARYPKKSKNSQYVRSLEAQWRAHYPKSIFVPPLGGLTSVCLNTRRDETVIPLGPMPSEAMAAGPKCQNQPTCESGAGPVKNGQIRIQILDLGSSGCLNSRRRSRRDGIPGICCRRRSGLIEWRRRRGARERKAEKDSVCAGGAGDRLKRRKKRASRERNTQQPNHPNVIFPKSIIYFIF
jgi:hypothetical protein